jgi:CCR4-NOT transcription complex subunit 1
MYMSDPNSLPRILDVAQELKYLAPILDLTKFGFTIDLAALASRRELLNFEQWIEDHIRVEGDLFIHACLEFINEKVLTGGKSPNYSLKTITSLLRILHQDGIVINDENLEFREKVVGQCNLVLPRIEKEEEFASFPSDIEEEVNTFYEQIYKGELSIPNVIEHLKRLQQSQTLRDQETFKCMVHNLFDEYKFFARYPERELIITSILFGVLIQNQIFTSMALGVALRYVLEALRQPVGSKLFQFGVQSLAQFQERLGEWPQYCALLLQIPHLHQTLPEAIALIKNLQAQALAVEDFQPEEDGMLFSSLKLGGILKESSVQFEQPSENFRDKILFIVNNISEVNVGDKVDELGGLLQIEHVRWFCHYIVVKRASIEPNFHAVYISFLELLHFPEIHSNLLYETLFSIRDLLNSEKTLNSSQERSYLKNLGAWLGSITLARNKPIKHKNLALKELLMEGFEHKRLIVVIPFVCKVLEQCSSSKVFNPPNPWLMAIMRVLAELYHFAELKLNLKFEIEVLCKNIKLDIKDLTPSNLLRIRMQNSQRRDTRREVDPRAYTEESEEKGYPNLASFIVFNPNISLFNTHPSLKRIVYIAIDRSIREVIQSAVVERSVTIAIVATRELVAKDFSLEPNEDKMRIAAHCMVQSLAGSLASVSSRDPLKTSMITNLRSLLSTNGFTEQTVPDQIVFIIVSDNMDLACSVMEKAAAEKAIPEIDESLWASFNARRKHREQRPGQPFYDPAMYASQRYLQALPESLRLSATGISPTQVISY